ncbi:MAG: cobyric acid synthase [Bacillota bacterium]
MLQGTASTVGKSLLTAAFLRILKQDGYSVAPFKSQNMALNSFVTASGGEMGRAQVMQAEAAGVLPDCSMNPILIKPTADTKAQVILNGKALGNLNAMEYHNMKDDLRDGIRQTYATLEKRFDYIVIEGAGSPAEINLSDNDLVNMGMAKLADAPVILIGDIDRGGVFASLYGTIMLLKQEERERVKAVIINKFRGDAEILKPGLTMLEDLIGIPVLGVIPYMDIDLEEEDSVSERFRKSIAAGAQVKIGVVYLPYMSNFTDFNMLYREHGVGVEFISSPGQMEDKDLIIIPGSKNTIGDLTYLKKAGLAQKAAAFAANGGLLMGICGGYQMLGKKIYDPERCETDAGEALGLGLLDFEVTMQREKVTAQSRGKIAFEGEGLFAALNGCSLEGYEIHMGQNVYGSSAVPVAYLDKPEGGESAVLDMVCNNKGNVFGTYLHGIFDNGIFLRGLINYLRGRKGMEPLEAKPESFADFKEREYDRLADIVRHNTDMELFYHILRNGS